MTAIFMSGCMLNLKNNPEEKLKELGLTLPQAPKPVASYIPTLIISDLLFTSGNLPIKDGKIIYQGKMGEKNNTIEIGYEASSLATLNSLRQQDRHRDARQRPTAAKVSGQPADSVSLCRFRPAVSRSPEQTQRHYVLRRHEIRIG